MAAVPVGLALLGGFAYYTFVTSPANSQTRDKSQVAGSAIDTTAGDTAPAIYTTSEDAPGISALRSQLGPPRLTALPPAARSGQSNAYQSILPNGQFNPPGAPDQLRNFADGYAASAAYHADHPASIPFPNVQRRPPSLPQFHNRGRALQYLATVAPTRIGTVSVLGHRLNPAKHATDMAATAASLHAGTLVSNSLPAIYLDPESPHTSNSLFTKIKTGRTVKSVV